MMYLVERLQDLTEEQKTECIRMARALPEYFDSAGLEICFPRGPQATGNLNEVCSTCLSRCDERNVTEG